MNIFKKVTAKFISRMSVNFLRVGLLLPVLFASSVSFAAESVCAVVKIEIQQELTLERQAFDAQMKINNNLTGITLEDVGVDVLFEDEAGNSVLASSDPNNTTAKFFIRIDSMTNIQAVDGTGTVAPQTTAEVHWLIIPAPGAGGDVPTGKLYSVGAVLHYLQGGEQKDITVAPDTIYVKPLPLLTLDYFLEKDVYADDAFTPEVEPAVPFTLGVRIANNGSATASSVKIESAQPTITENVQGLKIGFNIIGSSVNDSPVNNSLLINFGDIPAKEATVGRWDMVTTLSGRFTDFSADFTHADELGGRLTSIIDPNGINTHFLVHNVLVDVAGRDLIKDFLAKDGDVYRVYESSGVDTVVTDQSIGSLLTAVNSGDEVSLTLTTPITAGFSYVSLKDPFSGTKVIKQMVRSDGKTIPLENAWLHKTRKTVPADGWDYWVNFFDANSTGTYSVLMGVPDLGPVPPEFTPIGTVTTYETATVTFPVSAIDPNGDAVTLTSGTLPANATFTSDTSGSGTFTWTPAVGQAGNHVITFTASDGTLTKQTSVTIKVNPVWDTDGDGMDDAWEIANFGDLSRDGSGDLDGDGISDLNEYLNQTDPNLDPPLVPTNLVALPGNAENTLNWDTVTGVDSYNVYWSLTSDVSPTTGTLVNAPTSPFVHAGLNNDVTYYYVITSVGAGGESAGSNVVSVTTGVRDWTAPISLQSNSASTFTPLNAQIAMSANGEAIAVWQQTDNGLNSIWSSRYVSLTGWTTPALISDATVDSTAVQIAMDADGNALAVWQQVNVAQTDIMATRFDVLTNTWSTAAAIETDDTVAALNPQIVISKAGTNAGNALVVWQQGATIMSNSYVAQAWQTAAVVSTEAVTDLSQLTLSMNENGDAFAAWVSTSDQINYDLRVNAFSNNTWATTVVTLATGLDNWLQPAVDINASGNAVMAWPAFDGTRHVMMASQYDVSTGWGVAQAIETNLGEAKSAQVAMDANGNAFVAWAQNGSPYSIYVNRLDANLGFAASATLIETRERGDASVPQLVIDNRGNAIVSWQHSDGVQQNILAAVYNNADSTWGAERIIETTNSGDAILPAMAVSDSGNVIVAWQQNNNGELTIAANHFAVGNNGLPNINPIAVAGVDQTVNEQTAVTLDGSASFDQDGSGLISTYSWTQTSGTAVTLTGATTATPGFTAPTLIASETLTFELTVTDDMSATSTSTVNITVNPVNAVPTANAGVEQNVNEQTVVTLTGSGTDTDGTIDTYSWTQLSGTTVTLATANTTTATFDAPTVTVQQGVQTLVFELTVTDNEGATATSQVNVLVSPVNAEPVANAGVDQSVDEQTAVSLVGSGSDTDGVISTYAWTQVSGLPVTLTGETTTNASFTSPVVLVQDGAQTIVLRLTVTDNEGASFSDDISVVVNAVNALPTADAGLPQSVDEQTTVAFSATTADLDGSIVSYQWAQTTGNPVTIINANTVAASFVAPTVLAQDGAQTFSFTLTVTDNEGAVVTSAPVTITVNPVNALPTADAGLPQSVDEQTTVTFSATTADLDGSIVSYQWAQTAGNLVTIINANTVAASFVAPTVLVQEGAQTFSFTLTVTDNEGAVVTSAPVTITVNPVNALPTADAGLPQSVDEQTTVAFSATTADLDGSIVNYLWAQTAGNPVTIINANTVAASFVAPIVLVQDGAQTFSFTLTVTDNEGAVVTSAPVTITVNPVNALPTVSAGLDKTVDEQTAVNLTAAANDGDGSISSYNWTQVSGVPVTLTGATSANVSFAAPTVLVQEGAQTLTFRVIVTDNETATVFDDINVIVNPVNTDPVANAGVDKAVDEQTAVTLAGSGTDTDGSITTYQWTQTSGATVTLTGANTANAAFTTPVVLVQDGAQTLTFRLTVTDNEAATVFDDINVVVNPVNANPTANAGVDQNVDEQTAVTLAGSGADADGSITAYQWTQTSGVTVTLTGAATANASFTAPTVLVQEGVQTLTFRLTVTDNETATVFDDINVVVNPVNVNPTANAGIDQNVNEQTAVTLIGSGADTDGSITAYQWTQTSGTSVTLTNATAATATFSAPVVLVQDGAQTLTFRLTVTDNETATVFDDINVVVNPVNANPTANAGVDQNVNEQTAVTLAGSGADTDGSITAYQWTQTSGLPVTLANANAAVATFTSPVVLVQDGVQTLTFRLTVTDNETATVFDDISLVVNPVNANPVANAGTDQSVNEQSAVTLAGSGTDSDGSITTYQWTQTVGLPVTLTGANTATATFTSPTVLTQDGAQTLIFSLTVTDNEAATHTDIINVIVNPVNANPTVNAGVDKIVDEQTPVSLTAAANDSDGSIASYNWSQVSGMPVTLTNTTSAVLNFTAPTVLVPQGTQVLTFRVSVIDNENAVVTDDVLVTVNPVNAIPTVSAGIDQTVDELALVVMPGTANDSDGSIIIHEWTQVAGPVVSMLNANTATMGFNAPRLKTQATLTFRLTVTDNEIAEAFDEVNVVVNPVNTLPIADAGIDQSVAETLNVVLDGSASNDPDVDGVISSYQWTQTAGIPVSLINANTAIANFTAPSVYQDEGVSFRLDIVDDEGGAATASTNVTLFSTNPDDDADGMLDVWEIQYFGNLNRDGTADDDADGATDLMEHDFGTDPFVSQGPGQPAISSPRGTEVTALQPTLTVDNGVHHASFTTTYQFEVYSDEAMTTLVTSATSVAEGVTSTAWVVDIPLNDNTHYYWRARSSGWVLQSDWVTNSFFVNTVNDVPAAFNISAPQDGVWVNSFTPKLSVTNSSDVDEDKLTYRFEVYADQAMTSLITSSLETIPGMNGVTSWTVDITLLENTWYTWRAIVTDEHGLSTTSNSASIFINTINDAPVVPVIVSPVKGSEITTLLTDVIVSNATDPEAETVTYFFELDTVNTFDSVNKRVSAELSEGLDQTGWFVDNLLDNTRYYWRVKASDGRAQSNWRNGEFFVNTINDVPGVPTLDNPTNNGWVGSMDPSLMVLPAIDIDEDKLSYEFEVYQSNKLGNVGTLLGTAVSNTTYWQVTPILPMDGWYKWRARAIDEHGAVGDWTRFALFYADSDGVNDAPRIKLDALKRIHKRKKKFCDLPTRITHRKFSWKHKDYDQTYKNKCREFVNIRWTDHDPDSNAFIKLFYSNTNKGQGGTLIKKGLREDPDHRKDKYRWDVTELPDGVYFVYAVINDGTTRKVRYSPNAIVVGDGAGQPYMEFTNKKRKAAYSTELKIKWADIDVDSNANIALYYDTNKFGFDGTLIVDGLTEDKDFKNDRYLWDITTMPAGKYFIYGIIQDETQTLRIYSPVRYKITVP